MLLCNDLELALLEPTVARDCASVATVVWQGTATVAGTTATTSSGAIASPPVLPGMLAYFPASKVTALFIARDSATASSICALTPGLSNDAFPASASGLAGPGDVTGVTMQIVTFPQVRPASDIVRDALGLTDLTATTQFDARAVRRAAAYLALSMIFRSMAAFDRSLVTAPNDTGLRYNADFRLLAEFYEGRYEREVRRVRVAVDADEEGTAEETRAVGTVGWARE
jgi:hypothetical protein